jgi:hypothetical protein
MNLQEKVFEVAADVRARASAFVHATYASALERADDALARTTKLKGPIAVLKTAGRELRKVARAHGRRFFVENISIARAAREDVSALARSALASLKYRGVRAKSKTLRKRLVTKRAVKAA